MAFIDLTRSRARTFDLRGEGMPSGLVDAPEDPGAVEIDLTGDYEIGGIVSALRMLYNMQVIVRRKREELVLEGSNRNFFLMLFSLPAETRNSILALLYE